MKTSSILIITIAITILISALSIQLTPSHQDFSNDNVSWNGLSDWRSSTTTVNVDTASLDTSTLPQDNIMLVIPDIPYHETELAQIKDFVSRGGTLVLIDDYGYGNDILSYFNLSARFTSKTVLDPLFCYKNPALPRISDFSPAVSKSGIKSVVLNHATSLTGVATADVLAWSSKDSFLDSNNNDQNKGPFPVAARLMFDKGTIILFTDPSIMINSMINLEDNSAMVHYLIQSSAEHPPSILLDNTHMEESTLDKSKAALHTIREFLTAPYPLLALIAIIFILVYRYGFKKGEILG